MNIEPDAFFKKLINQFLCVFDQIKIEFILDEKTPDILHGEKDRIKYVVHQLLKNSIERTIANSMENVRLQVAFMPGIVDERNDLVSQESDESQ